MPRYRIFTNDRGRKKSGHKSSVPLYSCLKEVEAPTEAAALQSTPSQFDAPYFAPAKAIQWPDATPEAIDWLKKHVVAN
jgi:hypothetical protein